MISRRNFLVGSTALVGSLAAPVKGLVFDEAPKTLKAADLILEGSKTNPRLWTASIWAKLEGDTVARRIDSISEGPVFNFNLPRPAGSRYAQLEMRILAFQIETTLIPTAPILTFDSIDD